MQQVWESTFAPHLYEYFGTLYSWTKLSDSEVKTISGIWAEIFPTETHLQDDKELESMVMKLVDDALGNWHHSFSSKAAEYLKNTIFSLTGVLNTKEACESWANWSLGSDFEGEQASYYRRFYYCEYEELAEPGEKITMKGIFQSPIVLEMLMVYYVLIKKLPAAMTIEEDIKYPTGTWCIAIQACIHNINKWILENKIDSGSKLRYFSAENWRDHNEVRMGTKVHIKSTSDIMTIMNSLKKNHTKCIQDSAVKIVASQKPIYESTLIEPSEPASNIVIKVLDDDSDSEEGGKNGEDN
ncbi:hypothetical protein H0H87_004382 [Tephrocybe sp. NHM501043]|nr:hypothetical protein H0H87_004382 [Tephrocybe sp. NHM501043]